jgi:hypothetical protein
MLVVIFFYLDKANSAVYECTYNNGLKMEYIATTDLRTHIVAKKTNYDLKYTFVLSDTNNFNELDDYVIIENKKGRKITYKLSCK